MKYLKAKTVVFVFVFPIPRKELAHCRNLRIPVGKMMKFPADSVKGPRERRMPFRI